VELFFGNGEVKDHCILSTKDMGTPHCCVGYAGGFTKAISVDLENPCEEKAGATPQNFDNFHLIR